MKSLNVPLINKYNKKQKHVGAALFIHIENELGTISLLLLCHIITSSPKAWFKDLHLTLQMTSSLGYDLLVLNTIKGQYLNVEIH